MSTHTPHPNAYNLTPREAEILELAALGCSTKDIATRLLISPFTVRQHLSSIYRKLGVRSRTAAGARWHVGSPPAQIIAVSEPRPGK